MDGQFSVADEYVNRRLRHLNLVRLGERSWSDQRPPRLFLGDLSVSTISAAALAMGIGLLCYAAFHGL